VHGGNNQQSVQAGGQMQGSGGTGINSLSSPDPTGLLESMAAQGSGDSALTDYDVQKNLAEATGGRAFYSTNDVTAALDEATDVGGDYYSLSYSPTNQKDDGGRRGIAVRVVQPGYKLSYRRFYFTSALRQPVSAQPSEASLVSPAPAENDTLQPNMKHGAPMVHDPSVLRARPRRRRPGEGHFRPDVSTSRRARLLPHPPQRQAAEAARWPLTCRSI
jgi:hypothetical protein